MTFNIGTYNAAGFGKQHLSDLENLLSAGNQQVKDVLTLQDFPKSQQGLLNGFRKTHHIVYMGHRGEKLDILLLARDRFDQAKSSVESLGHDENFAYVTRVTDKISKQNIALVSAHIATDESNATQKLSSLLGKDVVVIGSGDFSSISRAKLTSTFSFDNNPLNVTRYNGNCPQKNDHIFTKGMYIHEATVGRLIGQQSPISGNVAINLPRNLDDEVNSVDFDVEFEKSLIYDDIELTTDNSSEISFMDFDLAGLSDLIHKRSPIDAKEYLQTFEQLTNSVKEQWRGVNKLYQAAGSDDKKNAAQEKIEIISSTLRTLIGNDVDLGDIPKKYYSALSRNNGHMENMPEAKKQLMQDLDDLRIINAERIANEITDILAIVKQQPKEDKLVHAKMTVPGHVKEPEVALNRKNELLKGSGSNGRRIAEVKEKVEKIKTKQAETYENFSTWQREQKWESFAHAHYDWWMFPVERPSRNYGEEYSVTKEQVKALKEDEEFMRRYHDSIRMVLLSWGWDIDTGKPITPSNSEQIFRGGTKMVRLGKIASSLRLFGEQEYWDSLRNFVLSRGLTHDLEPWMMESLGFEKGNYYQKINIE